LSAVAVAGTPGYPPSPPSVVGVRVAVGPVVPGTVRDVGVPVGPVAVAVGEADGLRPGCRVAVGGSVRLGPGLGLGVGVAEGGAVGVDVALAGRAGGDSPGAIGAGADPPTSLVASAGPAVMVGPAADRSVGPSAGQPGTPGRQKATRNSPAATRDSTTRPMAISRLTALAPAPRSGRW
jgi:hypothetical protein